MKRTAEEIAGRVRGELKRAVTAEARAAADQQAEIGRERWAAMGKSIPTPTKESDGAREARAAGFVGNAAMVGAGVRLVDPLATLAGWKWERVAAAAGLGDFPEEERAVAMTAARLEWWEARVRVAIRHFLQDTGAALLESAIYDEGEKVALERLFPDECAEKIRNRCTAVFLDETRNWMLKAAANVEEAKAAAEQNGEYLQAVLAAVTGTADKTAKAHALVLVLKRFSDEVGASVNPGSKVALAHFVDFMQDSLNKAALGRAQAWRTFRKKYAEWIAMGRPDTGKEYLQKLKEAKRQKAKERRARG